MRSKKLNSGEVGATEISACQYYYVYFTFAQRGLTFFENIWYSSSR